MKYPPIEDIYDLVHLAIFYRDPKVNSSIGCGQIKLYVLKRFNLWGRAFASVMLLYGLTTSALFLVFCPSREISAHIRVSSYGCNHAASLFNKH